VERRKERGRGSAQTGEREGKQAGPRSLGCLSFLFLFLLLSYTQLIQANLIEFKIQFEFKPINSTQLKQCCSMNAQTI
jgi:hypothetical protein